MSSRLVVALLSLALASPAAAQEHLFPFHGGDGGTSFDLTCGNDAVLVGVGGRGGQWLDQITARCVKVKSNGDWNGTPFTRGPAGGGGGNTLGTQDCPAGSAVAGISGRHGWYVHSLKLACYDMGTNGTISGSSTQTITFGPAGGDRSWTWEVCPDAKPGRGLRGRAAGFVDAVRFSCHSGSGFPRTAALVTAPPVLLSPPDLTTLTATSLRPAFQWQYTSAARRYRLCVTRPRSTASCDALNVTVNQAFSGTTPIPITSFRPATDLQFNGTSQMTWTVTACNDLGCGPTSAGRRLNAPATTTPTPPAVTFVSLAPTFRHARCSNCHAVVASGFAVPGNPGLPSGHTAVTSATNAAASCRTCHTTALLPAAGTVDPGWHGPPSTMNLSGRTDAELCALTKSLGSGAAVQQHLTQDKLVLWAVGDGRRPNNLAPLPLAPPGTIASWQTMVTSWVNAGMPCS